MNEQGKTFLIAGAIAGFLAVALGAFAAHGLKNVLAADMLTVFENGVRYQMYHAFALLGIGILAERQPSPHLGRAGWCMIAGIVLFSGSLYILTLSGIRILGAVTPFGGLSFLAGWALLGFASLKRNPSR